MRYFQAAGSGMAEAKAIPLNQFSVECWFYPLGIQPSGIPCIIADRYDQTNGSNINYAFWLDGGALSVRIAQHQAAVGWAVLTNPVALTDNTWHHLVHTYDQAYGRLFMNGVEVANQAQTLALPSPGIGLRFGRRWDLAEYMNGILDEVAIYNRALNLAEIREHWQRGFGTHDYLTGSAAGVATVNARAPKRLPFPTLTDDWEDGVITPDKWLLTSSGLTTEQLSRPWGVRV